MEIIIHKEYLELEPIGLLFVIFFGIILCVQFLAMLVHRFGTISQILATTELNWYCNKSGEEHTAENELNGNAVDIALAYQKPPPQWDEHDMTAEQEQIGRRQTIHKILYQNLHVVDYSNLEANFKRRFFKKGKQFYFQFFYINSYMFFLGDIDINTKNISVSKKSILLLNKRRQSLVEQRNHRRSQLLNSNQNQESVPQSIIRNTNGIHSTEQWVREQQHAGPSTYEPNVFTNINLNDASGGGGVGHVNRAYEANYGDESEIMELKPTRRSVAFREN